MSADRVKVVKQAHELLNELERRLNEREELLREVYKQIDSCPHCCNSNVLDRIGNHLARP